MLLCAAQRVQRFFEDIIANGNADGPAIITIAASDKGFQSQNCGTWTQNLSQITKSKTSFDEGAYIVGTDIEPGTYKNTGNEAAIGSASETSAERSKGSSQTAIRPAPRS